MEFVQELVRANVDVNYIEKVSGIWLKLTAVSGISQVKWCFVCRDGQGLIITLLL